MADSTKSGNWGCVVVLTLLIIGYIFRTDLAKKGFDTTNFGGGAKISGFPLCKKRVTSIYVTNTDDEPNKDVRLEVEILRENGDVIRKLYQPGRIESHAKWEVDLDQPIVAVKSIDFVYTTSTGASKSTLDLAEPKEYSQEDLQEYRKYWTHERANTFAQGLLAATHPTGNFRSTDYSEISLGDGSIIVRHTFSVSWSGGFTGDGYLTQFLVEFTKDGLRGVTVISDNASVPHNPNRIREFELAIQNQCD